MVKYLNKKTFELSDQEFIELKDVFNSVFEKDVDVDFLVRKYKSPSRGFSYHALMMSDDKIVGATSVIPFSYIFFGKEVEMGLSVDTMIMQDFRKDLMSFKRMENSVCAEIKKDNIAAIFGFPNTNSYLYFKKVNKWQDVGNLNYYLHVIKIGNIKPALKFANLFSGFYSFLVNATAQKSSKRIPEFPMQKVNDEKFLKYRYQVFPLAYEKLDLENGAFCVYTKESNNKVEGFEKAKIAYLIDVFPLSKANFQNSISRICDAEKGDLDMILYVGSLPFTSLNVIKAPRFLEPVPIRLGVKILDPGSLDEKILNIKNWNINLSNYDVF